MGIELASNWHPLLAVLAVIVLALVVYVSYHKNYKALRHRKGILLLLLRDKQYDCSRETTLKNDWKNSLMSSKLILMSSENLSSSTLTQKHRATQTLRSKLLRHSPKFAETRQTRLASLRQHLKQKLLERWKFSESRK